MGGALARRGPAAHPVVSHAGRGRPLCSILAHAVTTGERFDLATAEPSSWGREGEDLAVHQWAQRWVAEQWPEWQPRTRRSAIEALTRFLPLVVRDGAPKPPATLRTYGSWGRIDVTEADIGDDTPGEPKTGPRSVPIPPVLVGQLQAWLSTHDLAHDDLLFRTRTGGRPSTSNWGRAWHRAQDTEGAPSWRIYDCRHAAATTRLASGAPLGEVARRLGHTVDTLVSTYVGALTGDEELTNARIAAVLDPATVLAVVPAA